MWSPLICNVMSPMNSVQVEESAMAPEVFDDVFDEPADQPER